MEEERSVSFRDLIRVKVFDAEGKHIGHIQDMAIEKELGSQVVEYLAVHLLWTDKVGDIELVRSVEDVVLLLRWTAVAGLEGDAARLTVSHSDLVPVTARDKWLIRRDILDRQMLDTSGNRIQRVDDVLLAVEEGVYTIHGLEVSRSFFLASSNLRNYIGRLRKKHASQHEPEVIPWEAVERIEDDVVVIGERVGA